MHTLHNIVYNITQNTAVNHRAIERDDTRYSSKGNNARGSFSISISVSACISFSFSSKGKPNQ